MMKTIKNIGLTMVVSLCSQAVVAETAGVEVVAIGDQEWAQVDQFIAVSGEEISRVCPGGNCDAGTGGTLAGLDMSGWTWASEEEVAALFSAISPYPGLGEEYAEPGSEWAPAIFDKIGFRPTAKSDAGRALMGRTSSASDIYRNVTGALSDFTDPTIGDAITTDYWTPHHYTYSNIGAFFYRNGP
jgi:hypothetical protein